MQLVLAAGDGEGIRAHGLRIHAGSGERNSSLRVGQRIKLLGAVLATGIDAWLQEGGLVVTASDRAARALAAEFHRARQAEGLSAWPTPKISDWKSFVRDAWLKRSNLERSSLERMADARLLLNPLQEEALWEHVAGEDRSLATLLEGPRHRLAALAMEAHGRLCGYAPPAALWCWSSALQPRTRPIWPNTPSS